MSNERKPLGGRLGAMNDLGRFGTVGLELLVFFGVGYGAGRAFDGHFKTTFGVPVGMAFGLFGGFWNLWKLTQKAQAALEREDRIAGRKTRKRPAEPTETPSEKP